MTDIVEQVREQAAKVADQLAAAERVLERGAISRTEMLGSVGYAAAAAAGEAIAAAIRAMPLPAAGWQPIETAPKDGTRILGWSSGDGVCIVAFGDTPRRTRWYENHPLGRLPIKQPTHWMPLPAPPEDAP